MKLEGPPFKMHKVVLQTRSKRPVECKSEDSRPLKLIQIREDTI